MRHILIFLLFLIICIIIYLIKIKTKSGFTGFNKKIIKGTYTKNKFKNIEDTLSTDLDKNNINVYLGNEPKSNFLKLGGKYLVRAQLLANTTTTGSSINALNTLYLNSPSNMCSKEEPNNCYNKVSKTVEPVILTDKEQLEILNNSGYWTFESINKTKNDYIHYGEPVYIRNLSRTSGYLSVCDTIDSTLDESELKCKKTLNIYKYSSIEDATENGQWILIPKYEYNSKSKTKAYDFKTKLCSNSAILTQNDDNIICKRFKTCNTLDTALKCKTNQLCKWDTQCILDQIKFKSVLENYNYDSNKYTNLPITTSLKDKQTQIQCHIHGLLNNRICSYRDNIDPDTQKKLSTGECKSDEIFNIREKLLKEISVENFVGETTKESKEKLFNNYIKILFNDKLRVKLGNKHNDQDKDQDISKDYSSKEPVYGDLFYIVNKKVFNDKFVYLNRCNHKSFNYECNNKKATTTSSKSYNKVIGSVSDNYLITSDIVTDIKIEAEKETNDFALAFGLGNSAVPEDNPFKTNNNNVKYYLWNIIPINYNVNVKNTLYVHNSIKLGKDKNSVIINADSLRRIKNMPYVFNNKLCLKKTSGDEVCINKDHIDMMRGDINMNLENYVNVQPFTLYSRTNFQGRELKFGFDYKNIGELPFLQDNWEQTNPYDDGKWRSLKIDGPYSIIIYDQPNNSSPAGDNNKCSYACPKIPATVNKDKTVTNEQQNANCEASCNNIIGCAFKKSIDKNSSSTSEPVKIGTGKDCKPHSDWLGEKMSVSECASKCSGTGGFVHATRGDMDCRCVNPVTCTQEEKEDYDIYSINGDIQGKCVSNADKGNKKTVTGSISDVKWTNGIRSVSFPYFTKDENGNTKLLDINPIQRKCMSSTTYLKGETETPIFTFDNCNNTGKQHYRLFNSDHYKDKDYTIDSNAAIHGHFHRHNLDETHE